MGRTVEIVEPKSRFTFARSVSRRFRDAVPEEADEIRKGKVMWNGDAKYLEVVAKVRHIKRWT